MMNVLEFINAHKDWEGILSIPPYNLRIKRDGCYFLLEYNMYSSDFALDIVQECRGIIFHKDGYCVARPFKKFFNYGEECAAEIDWNTAYVTEKIDGSLMKAWYHNGWHLSTNGTIDAYKAIVTDKGISFGEIFERALGYPFEELCKYLNRDYTYCFELTSPKTTVIIPYDYGVYFLTAFNTKTGEENRSKITAPNIKFPAEYSLYSLDDAVKVVSQMSKDHEGIVVADGNGNRIKVKSPEYLIAAHLNNNGAVTTKRIINYIQNGVIDDFVAYMPRYKSMVDKVFDRVNEIAVKMQNEWEHLPATENRKDFARLVSKSEYNTFLFQKFDNVELSAIDWLWRLMPAKLAKLVDNI